MSFVVAPIVEGHGDVAAVPELLRKLRPELRVARPVRFPKSKLVNTLNTQDLVRAVLIARANIIADGMVLLLVDADEDCPAELGPRLLGTMTQAVPGVKCLVVVAAREFENWVLGGDPVFDEPNPEAAGGAKQRIAASNGGHYKETADQARFASRIEPDRLRPRSRSFARFVAKLDQIQA